MAAAVSPPKSRAFDSLPDRLAARAIASAHAIALSAGDEVLTYRQLHTRANAIAHRLLALGVVPGEAVALLAERTPDAVAGALAILQAGGAYVPLDVESPAERLGFMLRESGVRVVLTDGSACALPGSSWRIVRLDEIEDAADEAPAVTMAPGDLAYIIFTSGSTGRPKGVALTHGGLANLIDWHLDAFGVTPRDRASQVARLGFDAAVWEIWPYLAAGASVHMPGRATCTEPEALRDWLVRQRISIGFAPTVLAEHLIRLSWPADTQLRFLLTGADTLRHFPPHGLPFALVNNYGPTECTVVATSGITLPGETSTALPSIGRPIRNTRVYILDENLRPLQAGLIGELHIGGAGLARGYLNQPRLTLEKFIPDPFSADPEDRLYKTGDLARQLPSGEIAFAGRIDNQVKIRGYRVEPDEIAATLNLHPDVEFSVVKACEDQDQDHEKRLTAYVVRRAGASASVSILRDFVRTRLPEYMVPSTILWLDRLPLSANGKLDLKALPAPAAEVSAEPAASIEERLSAIVAALLHTSVARDDNFFFFGAHSLFGAKLVARIRAAFGVDLTLRNVFEQPTIAGLAEVIVSKRSSRGGEAR